MAVWRSMTIEDVDGLLDVANQIHPDLPEDRSVFAERVELFPDGCLTLVENDEVGGYAISHPIRNGQPPALNSLLGEIVPDADQYYIHDVAVLPKFRGQGLAAVAVNKLLEIAKGYPSTCLISVYGTASFWGRFGFKTTSIDQVLSDKLRDYGADATYLVRGTSDDDGKTR